MGHFKIHFAIGKDFPPLEVFFDGKFNVWLELQNQRNFQCDEIVSLIHLGGDKWLFAGVYAVEGVKPLNEGEPDIYWHPEGVPRICFKYSTRELDGLEHLTGHAIMRAIRQKIFVPHILSAKSIMIIWCYVRFAIKRCQLGIFQDIVLIFSISVCLALLCVKICLHGSLH